MRKSGALRVLIILLGALALCDAIAPPTKRPNIIFVLADDMGYGEVEVFPAKSPHGRIATPNLNQFAAEGMIFTDAYAGEAVCAPSRNSLMTGQHTGHTFIRGNYPGDLPLPSNYTTVASVLQSANYTTALIGKWGLGQNGTEGHPLLHGFDYYYGQLGQGECHNYYPSYVWENFQQVNLPLNANQDKLSRTFCMDNIFECSYTHDLFTNKTFEWLQQNGTSAQPFFLYLAYTVPHAGGWGNEQESGEPVPSDGEYATQTSWPDVEQDHASMLTNYLDRDVGRLIALLKELKLDNNTIIFFASDNGALNEGGQNYTFFDSSGPLRGFKRSLYEGGIRSPSMIRWPGVIEPNTTSNFSWAFWDFLPTAAELAGLSVNDLDIPYEIDGISIVPTLFNSYQEPHEYLYWEFCTNNEWGHAVRSGNWKAVSFSYGEPFQLYDLSVDIGETNDIASEYPSVIAQLTLYAEQAHQNSTLFPIKDCHSS